MSALARLLGVFAPGHALEHGGKQYTFDRIDKTKRVALEAKYFRRAREGVYAMKDGLSEEQYDRHLTRVTDSYRRGEYGFPYGESYRYYLGPGLAELVMVMTGCDEADAERLREGRGVEVLHVVLCVVTESFGDDFKKKLLQMADTPQMEALTALLTLPPPQNGSPSPKSTGPQNSSPTAASASSSTPA